MPYSKRKKRVKRVRSSIMRVNSYVASKTLDPRTVPAAHDDGGQRGNEFREAEGSQVRIAISGSHDVGKTYLAKQLTEKMMMPLITETVRTAAADMGIKNCSEIINGSLSTKNGVSDANLLVAEQQRRRNADVYLRP